MGIISSPNSMDTEYRKHSVNCKIKKLFSLYLYLYHHNFKLLTIVSLPPPHVKD